MESLKGSIETVQIVLGTMLLPILTSFINTYLIPGVNVLMQFAQALGGNADALAGLSPQLQLAVAGVQGFMVAAQPVIDVIAANLIPILTTLAGIAGGLLVGALVAAAAPFAPLIAAIGVAIAVGAALYGAWQQDFGGIQEATATAMAAVQDVITAVMGVVLTFWEQNGAQIMAFAQTTWATIQQIIGTVVTIIATIVTAVFGTIASFISEHGAEIQVVLQTAWNSVQNIIQLALDVIQGITTTVLGILEGDWGKATDGIKQIVSGLGTFLSAQWENIRKLVVELGPKLLSAAQEVGKAIVDGIASGISSAAGAIADAARSAAQAALNAAKSLLGIKSPSTLFADEIGEPISQGMAVGIAAAASAPAMAAQLVAAGAVRAAQQQVAAPATSYATSTTYGGDSYSFDMRGASLTEGQAQAAFSRALSARTSRASRLSRVGGGAG